jgi:hypothetical protein
MGTGEKYGGHLGAHQDAFPGDPRYVSVEESVRRHMARVAAYEALPEIIAKRRRDAEADARIAAAKAATRKRPEHQTTTDYPWLKPGWEW